MTLASVTSIMMMTAPSGMLSAGSYTIFSGPTATDYSGVTVTAPSSGLEVATATTIVSSTNRLVVTLVEPTRLYWDGDAGGNPANNVANGGNGTWSSAGTNWTGSTGATNGTLSGSTITPYFQGTAGTVTVSESVSVAGMTFGANGYLLTGGTIGLTESPSTIVVGSGVTATIASNLTGSGGLFTSGGNLVLLGTNSFTGGTSVNAGTLTLNGGSALADGGSLNVGGNGELQLGAAETVGALSGDGAIKLNAYTLTTSASTDTTIAGSISGTGGLVKAGTGTLTLGGNNTFSGGTTITGCTLVSSAATALASTGALVVSNTVANSGGLNVQSGGLTVANGGNVVAPVTVGGGSVTVGQGGNVSAPITVDSGTVTVDGRGHVSAPVTVNGGAVTVSSGGTVAASVTVENGNSPGTLVFTAPVTLNAMSLYQVEIDGNGTGTGADNHDQVVVRGASFTAGGRLTPILRGIIGSATNRFTPTLGQSVTVVTADGGVSGRFATLDQPASGLAAGTRLDLLYGSNAVALVTTPASYANLGAAGLTQSSNQRSVGAALDSFRPVPGAQASDTTTQALFDNLHTLSGGQITPALNQLSGAIHADTLAAAQANRRLFGRAVEARQAAGRGAADAPGPVAGVVQFLFDGKTRSVSGLAEGPDGTARATGGGASLWGQPLVGRGRTGDDGNGGTVDRFTGGFLVGSDHAIDPELKAGGALGFLRTRVKAEAGLGKGTVDSYQATAYGSWTPGAAFVDAALGYGQSRYETSRSMSFGNVAGVASGEAGGNDLSAELSAGTRVALDGASWVEPRVGLRWDRLVRGGFTESGTPLLSLTEETATRNALRSSVGLRVGKRLGVGEMVVEPTGLLGWEHDWRDVDASATGALNSALHRAVEPARPRRGGGERRGERDDDPADLRADRLARRNPPPREQPRPLGRAALNVVMALMRTGF